MRIHDTYMREYSMRTDFSVRLTRYDTQYVRIFPRKLHETIHSTYRFPRTNYTIQYIVRTEVSIVPRGPVWSTVRITRTYGLSMFIRERFYSCKLYFLLLRNKINLQSVEGIIITFFFSPSRFSVVLISNQWSKGIVSTPYLTDWTK